MTLFDPEIAHTAIKVLVTLYDGLFQAMKASSVMQATQLQALRAERAKIGEGLSQVAAILSGPDDDSLARKAAQEKLSLILTEMRRGQGH
jgi:hypothetical protein